jgi:hypothetical protein
MRRAAMTMDEQAALNDTPASYAYFRKTNRTAEALNAPE